MSLARGTPCGVRYGELFADWELSIARRLAFQFHRTRAVRRTHALEDLVQEVLICWLGVRDQYALSRGALRESYMAVVGRNRLLELTRRQRTASRKLNHLSMPFSTPFSDAPDCGTIGDLVEAAPERSAQAADIHDLRIALRRILPELTARERRILKLLRLGLSKVEAARALSIHRDTLHVDVLRIRKVLIDNGLADFLT